MTQCHTFGDNSVYHHCYHIQSPWVTTIKCVFAWCQSGVNGRRRRKRRFLRAEQRERKRTRQPYFKHLPLERGQIGLRRPCLRRVLISQGQAGVSQALKWKNQRRSMTLMRRLLPAMTQHFPARSLLPRLNSVAPAELEKQRTSAGPLAFPRLRQNTQAGSVCPPTVSKPAGLLSTKEGSKENPRCSRPSRNNCGGACAGQSHRVWIFGFSSWPRGLFSVALGYAYWRPVSLSFF